MRTNKGIQETVRKAPGLLSGKSPLGGGLKGCGSVKSGSVSATSCGGVRSFGRLVLAVVFALTTMAGFGISATPSEADAALLNTEQTAYVYYTVSSSVGKKGFNVLGVSNGSASIKTSYGGTVGNGYEVDVAVDGTRTDALAYTSNGQTITVSGIAFKQTLSIVNDDAYVRVSYEVTNTTTASHTISLGNWTDVQIGSNDKAPIEPTSTGARMYESSGGNQFNMICKNAYGVTDVDTLWFGVYSNAKNNLFTGTKSSAISGLDSGIAIGWINRVIPAGETRTFSYLLGVGEAAAPPEINGSVNVHVNPQTVDVSAQVKDTVGRTDRLYYVLDMDTELESDPAILDTHKFTSNAYVSMSGVIPRPTSWQVGEVHTVSVWVMNEANAMSPVVTKAIVIKDDEEEGDVMQEGVNVSLHFLPGAAANGTVATGSAPADKQVFELQEVELPNNTFTAPSVSGTTLKFAGWRSEDGKMYQPGAKFTMPERTAIIDANTRTNYNFTAVWMTNGESIYYVDIYLQQKDGTYKKKQEITYTGAENSTANIADKISEFAQDGYQLNTTSGKTKMTGTIVPATSASLLRLALYYDLQQFYLTFDVDDMPGLSNSVATLYYNTSLADSTTATMRTLADQTYATFGGWYGRTNGKGAQLTAERRIKANETYYAYWIPKLNLMTFNYNYTNPSTTPAATSVNKALEETRAEGSGYANLGVKLPANQLPASLSDWTDTSGRAWRFEKWVIDGKYVVGSHEGQTVEVTQDTVFRVDAGTPMAQAQWYEVFPITLTNTSIAGGNAAMKGKAADGTLVTTNATADNVPVVFNCRSGEAMEIIFGKNANYQIAHITVNGVNYDQTIPAGKIALRNIRAAQNIVVSFVKSPEKMTFDYAYNDSTAGRVPASADLAAKAPEEVALVRSADRPNSGLYQGVALRATTTPTAPADWKDTTGRAWRFNGWFVDGSFLVNGTKGVATQILPQTEFAIRYNAESPTGYDDIAATAHWREVLPLTATCTTGGKVYRIDADSGATVTGPYHEVGSNAAVVFTANSGYKVSHVMVDGVWDDFWIDKGLVEFNDYRAAHTVYVEFEKDPSANPVTEETGTIKFSANGGTGTPASITGVVGTSTAAYPFPLATPVRDGYVFNGWNTKANGTGSAVTQFPSAFGKGTTIYYAKWEKLEGSDPDPEPQPGVVTGYIKFSANGGKGTPTGISGPVGASTAGSVFPAMVPLREGYVFAGWNTAADGSGTTVSAYPATYPDGTTVYYATWIEMGLDPDPEPEPGSTVGYIKFSANGGSGTPAGIAGSAGSAIIGEVFPAMVPVRTGYDFAGWNTLSDGTGEMVTAYPTVYPADGSTVVYHAQWIPQATTPDPNPTPDPEPTPTDPTNPLAVSFMFSANGGQGAPANIDGTAGASTLGISWPTQTPTRVGYAFEGWFDAPSGGSPVVALPATFQTNTTYYAHWVTADPDVPDAPPTAGMRGYIKFNVTGGWGAPTGIDGELGSSTAAYTFPTGNPLKSGYVFAGWNTEPDGTGTQVTAYPAVFGAGTTYYYAQWLEIPDQTQPDPAPTPGPDTSKGYIKFNANGGQGTPEGISGAVGASTTGEFFPVVVPQRAGFVFAGWNTAADGSGTQVTTYPATYPTGTVYYYAQWEQIYNPAEQDPEPTPGVHNGYIKFNANGGQGTPLGITGPEGDPITSSFPAMVPVKSGKVFAGWNTEADGSGTTVNTYPAVIPSGTVFYYAQWADPAVSSDEPVVPEPDPDPTNAYIKFDANGGTAAPAMVTGTVGASVSDPFPADTPRRKGYSFNGWNTKADGSGTYVAGFTGNLATFPQGTTILYAQWLLTGKSSPTEDTTYYTITTTKHGSTHATVTATHSVAQGDDTTVSWKPDAGYRITEVTVNGIDQVLSADGAGSIDFRGVMSNHEVNVWIEKIDDESATPSSGGHISDDGYVRVNTQIVGGGTIDSTASVRTGSNHTVNWTVPDGYEIIHAYLNDIEVNVAGTNLTLNRYTFKNLQRDASIKIVVAPIGSGQDPTTDPAAFDIYTNIINGVGTITPTTTLATAEEKSHHEVEWSIDVDKVVGSATNTAYPKYSVDKVEVDRTPIEVDEAGSVQTFTSVNADHWVDVYLKPNLVNVHVNVQGNGTASPDATLFMGEDYRWYATAAAGWHLQSISLDDGTMLFGAAVPGDAGVSASPMAVTANASGTEQEITVDREIDVVFVRDDGTVTSPDEETYDVTVALSGGIGTVASNYLGVTLGEDRTVSWTAGEGYTVKKVTVDRGGLKQVIANPVDTSLFLEGIATDVAVTVELEAVALSTPDPAPDPDPDEPVLPDPTPLDPTDPDPLDPQPEERRFDLNTSITAGRGSITERTLQIEEGEQVTVSWTANAGSYVSKVEIDGVEHPEFAYAEGDPESQRANLLGGSVRLTMNRDHSVVVTLIESYPLEVTVNGNARDSIATIAYGDPLNLATTAGPLSLPSDVEVEYYFVPVDAELLPDGLETTQTPTALGLYQVVATAEHYNNSQPTYFRIVPRLISVEATYPIAKAPAGLALTQDGTALTEDSYGYRLAEGSVLTEAGLAGGDTAETRSALQVLLGAVTATSYQAVSGPTAGNLVFSKPLPGTYQLTLDFANVDRTGTSYTSLSDYLARATTAAVPLAAPAAADIAEPEAVTLEALSSDYYPVGNYLVKLVDASIQIERRQLTCAVVDGTTGQARSYFTEGDAYEVSAALGTQPVGSAEGVSISFARKTESGGYELLAGQPTEPGRYMAFSEGEPLCFAPSDPVLFTIYAADDVENPHHPDNPYKNTRHIEVTADFPFPVLRAGSDVSDLSYGYSLVNGYSLFEGDTLESILGDATYSCTTGDGMAFNKANPRLGLYGLVPDFSLLTDDALMSTSGSVRDYKVGNYHITVRPATILVVDLPLTPEPDPDNPTTTPELPETPDPAKGDPTPEPGEDPLRAYIMFDANGGKGAPLGIEGEPEAAITESFPTESPVAAGYVFVGWNTRADGSGDAVTTYPAAFAAEPGTTYYYAQWERDPDYVPPVKTEVILTAYFTPAVSRAGVDISAEPYRVMEVPGFAFNDGDTVEAIMGEATYSCRTAYELELNQANPVAGEYLLRAQFAALGEPKVNDDGSWVYETDEYVITVLPFTIVVEEQRFNDEYQLPSDESDHDYQVDITYPDGPGKPPVVKVTDGGQELPADYRVENEYFRWNDQTSDWESIGSEAPATPGSYKLLVTIYDASGKVKGQAQKMFVISGPEPEPVSHKGSTSTGSDSSSTSSGDKTLAETGNVVAEVKPISESNEGWATVLRHEMRLLLAQTGDELPMPAITFAVAAFALGASLIALAAYRRLRRQS